MFHLDLFSPLGMGQRVRRGHSKSSAVELELEGLDLKEWRRER